MLCQRTVMTALRPRTWAPLVTVLALAGLVVAAAGPPRANADIPWPYQFMPTIDPYQPSDPQSTCNPSPKPGVVDFRNLLTFWFNGGQPPRAEISRNCDIGGRSEHKEGRALDYFIHARVEPAKTLRIIEWLTATDEHGNRHARGRRFGLMYIQSNSRIFSFSRPDLGWRWDSGNGCDGVNDNEFDCHINHMHFSFSWAGARKQTSWWTTTQWARSANSCGASGIRVDWWYFPSDFGPLVQVKRLRSPQGTYDTQAEIRNSPWRVEAGGRTYRANQALSSLASPRPRAKLPAFVPGGWCYVNLT